MSKLILIVIIITFLGCNSYNNDMNILLKNKKTVENAIKKNSEIEQKYRLITGYDELMDSIVINPIYEKPELVDSIHYLKFERTFFEDELKNINYSIDSLSKLK